LGFVKETAAIAVPPEEGGPDQLIVFYVENKSVDYAVALKEMQQLIKLQINPLFKVTDVVSINQLPRTASGKVMRRSLRDQYTP